MLTAKLIEESDERPDPELDDERRRYYRITDFGARTVRAEAQRLATSVTAARARRLLARNSGGQLNVSAQQTSASWHGACRLYAAVDLDIPGRVCGASTSASCYSRSGIRPKTS